MSNIDWEKSFKNHLRENPKASIHFKTDSLLMKIINVVLFWNSDFMKTQITTIGTKIYWPSEEYLKSDYSRALKVLMHELVHVYDYLKHKVLFPLGYLFPQILVLLMLLAPISPWFLLLFFALAPWPAPFRLSAEVRGYAQNMWFHINFTTTDSSGFIEAIRGKLNGPVYYFMSWRKEALRKRLKEEFAEICKNPPKLKLETKNA